MYISTRYRIGKLGSLLFTLGMAFILWAGQAVLASEAKSQGMPVVVELYTSQGCNSCPPAEAYLNKLAKRSDVIALEFHVDYWDYIGWKDPFASPAFSDRQRSYTTSLEMRYVYTPQMVLNGLVHEVGSREMSVEVAIDQQKTLDRGDYPSLNLSEDANKLLIELQANDYRARSSYELLLLSYDARHETKVTRGENRGRKLVSSNIVRDLLPLKIWQGGDLKLEVDKTIVAGTGGYVLLLQHKNASPKKNSREIIAAAHYKILDKL